jgi:hypothetical protein
VEFQSSRSGWLTISFLTATTPDSFCACACACRRSNLSSQSSALNPSPAYSQPSIFSAQCTPSPASVFCQPQNLSDRRQRFPTSGHREVIAYSVLTTVTRMSNDTDAVSLVRVSPRAGRLQTAPDDVVKFSPLAQAETISSALAHAGGTVDRACTSQPDPNGSEPWVLSEHQAMPSASQPRLCLCTCTVTISYVQIQHDASSHC